MRVARNFQSIHLQMPVTKLHMKKKKGPLVHRQLGRERASKSKLSWRVNTGEGERKKVTRVMLSLLWFHLTCSRLSVSMKKVSSKKERVRELQWNWLSHRQEFYEWCRPVEKKVFLCVSSSTLTFYRVMCWREAIWPLIAIKCIVSGE